MKRKLFTFVSALSLLLSALVLVCGDDHRRDRRLGL